MNISMVLVLFFANSVGALSLSFPPLAQPAKARAPVGPDKKPPEDPAKIAIGSLVVTTLMATDLNVGLAAELRKNNVEMATAVLNQTHATVASSIKLLEDYRATGGLAKADLASLDLMVDGLKSVTGQCDALKKQIAAPDQKNLDEYKRHRLNVAKVIAKIGK